MVLKGLPKTFTTKHYTVTTIKATNRKAIGLFKTLLVHRNPLQTSSHFYFQLINAKRLYSCLVLFFVKKQIEGSYIAYQAQRAQAPGFFSPREDKDIYLNSSCSVRWCPSMYAWLLQPNCQEKPVNTNSMLMWMNIILSRSFSSPFILQFFIFFPSLVNVYDP